ncbi:MAG: alginate export family protein [Campylobacterales bacterium]
MQQIIAGVTYTPTQDITVKFNIKDSRTYGWSLSQEKAGNENLWKDQTTGYVMNPNEEYFEVNDAYIEAKNLLTPGLKATIGRQSISYGDKSMFGPGEFDNTGRWRWDAVRVGYSWQKNFVDVWYGGTKIHDPDSQSFPDEHEFKGLGVYGHFTTTATGAIEPFYARKSSTSSNYSGTSSTKKGKVEHRWVGLRVYDDNLFNFYYDITYAKQSGHQSDVDTDAYGYAAMVGYHFKTLPMKPKVDYTRVYATGEKGGLSDGVQSQFDYGFGANDWVLGWMNLVSWQNIIDNEFKVTFKPTDKITVLADTHFYKLEEAQQGMTTLGKIGSTGPSKGLYDEVGQESNLEIRYQYNKDLQVRAWYCYFQPGDVIKNDTSKGATNNASWMALQLLYKFKI